ncbi:DinB family protein [Hugenholtzia roseola]|uniref:DinB family protein n=1 Tax=Hugenholtzia roseola TaxID=1002 RepID=UPI0003FAB5EB|nr:DinB family protein [Hugenholtzia roseola]
MKDLFQDLLTYSHHFNQAFSALLAENQALISQKAHLLQSHLLNAHQVWNNRILPQETIFGVWQPQAMTDFAAIDRANYTHSLLILDTFDLNQIISYQNSKSEPFSNSVQEIFFHIINHTTHHRAQITTELKNSGIKTPITDYIFYKR